MSTLRQAREILTLQEETKFLKERVEHLEKSLDDVLKVLETITTQKAAVKPKSTPKKTQKAH